MKITTHSNLKSQLYSRKTVHSQVKRESVGISVLWFTSTSHSLSNGRFWMWKWRVDACHEDQWE